MSSLCYFIPKKSSTFMFTSISIFSFTLKQRILRRCKRGLQHKFIISLKKYSYKDRLIQLNLPTLKYRRSRWDMIEVFKRVKQKYVTAIVPEISVNSSSVARGNNHHYDLRKYSFTPRIPPACMRDLACTRSLASISRSESDPWPVCGARRLSGGRLLSEVLQ